MRGMKNSLPSVFANAIFRLDTSTSSAITVNSSADEGPINLLSSNVTKSKLDSAAGGQAPAQSAVQAKSAATAEQAQTAEQANIAEEAKIALRAAQAKITAQDKIALQAKIAARVTRVTQAKSAATAQKESAGLLKPAGKTIEPSAAK